jgi:hypothetical protein
MYFYLMKNVSLDWVDVNESSLYESDSLEWCEATCFLFLVIFIFCNKTLDFFPFFSFFLSVIFSTEFQN